MKTIADLHMHTNVSQHAYATLDEMARSAKEKGLRAFAITNHGPGMIDGAIPMHFKCMKNLPSEIHGLDFYKGAEVNIKTYEGDLDLDNSLLDSLDFVIVSYHIEAIRPKSIDAHTRGWLNVIKNPSVDCLGHSGVALFEADYEQIVKACIEYNKIIEINSNSPKVRKGSDAHCLTIAKLCKKYGVKVVINSDAHSTYQVADHEASIKLLESIEFPENLVINSSMERLTNYFKRNK